MILNINEAPIFMKSLQVTLRCDTKPVSLEFGYDATIRQPRFDDAIVRLCIIQILTQGTNCWYEVKS